MPETDLVGSQVAIGNLQLDAAHVLVGEESLPINRKSYRAPPCRKTGSYPSLWSTPTNTEFTTTSTKKATSMTECTMPKRSTLQAMCTNTIEGFWSLLKRGIGAVYHSVSSKHLQGYLNEYSFRYNHRDDPSGMFNAFLRRVEKNAPAS